MAENQILNSVISGAAGSITTIFISKFDQLKFALLPTFKNKFFSPIVQDDLFQFLAGLLDRIEELESHTEKQASKFKKLNNKVKPLLKQAHPEIVVNLVNSHQSDIRELLSFKDCTSTQLKEKEMRDFMIYNELLEVKAKFENLETILKNAESQINEDADPLNLSMKFKNQFVETACDTEEDELKDLLSSILAEEINKPGKYSPFTLQIVSTMTLKDLERIKLLIPLKAVFHIYPSAKMKKEKIVFVYVPKEINKIVDLISYDDLKELEIRNIISLDSPIKCLGSIHLITLSDQTYIVNNPFSFNEYEITTCYLSEAGEELLEVLSEPQPAHPMLLRFIKTRDSEKPLF